MMSYRLISWNVNGIRAIEKKGFLDWLMKEKPDVLSIQETKAHPEQLHEGLVSPMGYKSFWNSAEKKGYSGVCNYVSTEKKVISSRKGMNNEKFDSEGRIVYTEFEDFILFNIYFPNGKKDDLRLQYKLGFYDAFLDYIESLRKKGKKIVFCGDLNTAHKEIDLSHPKNNENVSGFLPVERAWIDKVISLGYIDTLRHFDTMPEKYTWWDYKTRARERNIGWRLDYFFVSEELKENLKAAKIMAHVMGSDHCPVEIVLEF